MPTQRQSAVWIARRLGYMCSSCGVWLGPRFLSRKPAWCSRCEALLDAQQVLSSEPGTLVLDFSLGNVCSEPCSTIFGWLVLFAQRCGAQELILEPDSNAYHLTFVISDGRYKLVPPPKSLSRRMPQVVAAIANVGYREQAVVHGQIAVHFVGEVGHEEVMGVLLSPTRFGVRVSCEFRGERLGRCHLVDELLVAGH